MICQISQIQVSIVYQYVVKKLKLRKHSRVAMFYCIFVYKNCHKKEFLEKCLPGCETVCTFCNISPEA